jgi:predicted metal-dependent hydrolase
MSVNRAKELLGNEFKCKSGVSSEEVRAALQKAIIGIMQKALNTRTSKKSSKGEFNLSKILKRITIKPKGKKKIKGIAKKGEVKKAIKAEKAKIEKKQSEESTKELKGLLRNCSLRGGSGNAKKNSKVIEKMVKLIKAG